MDKFEKYVCICVFILVSLCIFGCDFNPVTRNFGGTQIIELPVNQKLINVSWDHNSNIWYLSRPMHDTEISETYEFKEQSTYGQLNGTVILKESKE
jgi:hypothetical protein